MGDADIRTARDRIEAVEKRIAALQEAGVDVGALRSQLTFAHAALREGRLTDVEAIADEVLAAARRVAESGGVSTEQIRRVRMNRAQLADEVKAAIDDEVRKSIGSAIPAAAPAAAPDPELAGRIDQLERRLAAIDAVEAHLGQVDERLAALDRSLIAVASIDGRMAAVEARTAGDPVALQQAVEQAIAAAVPRQIEQALDRVVAQLPTREDLKHITETLAADLDYRLERTAADHGWCSLSDVQASVSKMMREIEAPESRGNAASFARLETALTEFVAQTREQQDKLIKTLEQRVAMHTASITRRILAHAAPEAATAVAAEPELDAVPPAVIQATDQLRQGTELLSPTEQAYALTSATETPVPPRPATRIIAQPHPTPETRPGSELFPAQMPGSGPRPAVSIPATGSGLRPAANDPPTAALGHGSSGNHPTVMPGTAPTLTSSPPPADAAPAGVESDEDLHDLVTREVERRLSAGDAVVASTMGAPAPGPSPSQEIAAVVAAEIARQAVPARPATARYSEADLVAALARALPKALADEAVRTELFAVLALEAAAKPGALGELTGLRRFLKREVQLAADELAAEKVS